MQLCRLIQIRRTRASECKVSETEARPDVGLGFAGEDSVPARPLLLQPLRRNVRQHLREQIGYYVIIRVLPKHLAAHTAAEMPSSPHQDPGLAKSGHLR